MPKCTTCKVELDKEQFFYLTKYYTKCAMCIQENKDVVGCCDSCGLRADFNILGETIGVKCKTHKLDNMVNIKIKKKCFIDNCNNIADTKDKNEHYICKYHNTDNAIIFIKLKTDCQYLDCKTRASFNYVGESNPKFCSIHKEEGMIDVKNKKCEFKGCLKQPNFNFKEELTARFCKTHCLDGMINILEYRKCHFLGCPKIPSFNLPLETEGKFCSIHKEDGMIDVKETRICIEQNCTKSASWGFQDCKRQYCAEHKKENMIKLMKDNNICIECGKNACFNIEGEAFGKYCSKHKTSEMVDVRHLKCDICKKRSQFGYVMTLANKCSVHKIEGMVRYPKTRCKIKGCKNFSRYGLKNINIKQPIHCELHKTSDDIDLVCTKCTQCGTIDILNEKQLCISICGLLEPWERQKTHQKLKENRMNEILDKHIGIADFYDRKLPSILKEDNQRPDRVHRFNHLWLVIECDEFQHKKKSQCARFDTKFEEDVERMKNLYQIFIEIEKMPVVFIRYNPDIFYNNMIPSKISTETREQELVHVIDRYKELPQSYFDHIKIQCGVLYLFYDEYKLHYNTLIKLI